MIQKIQIEVTIAPVEAAYLNEGELIYSKQSDGKWASFRIQSVEKRLHGCRTCGKPCVKVKFSTGACLVAHFAPSQEVQVESFQDC